VKDLAPPIAIHLASALIALGVGPVIFSMRKGTDLHRALDRLWAASIVVAAVSSFWIRDIGGLMGFSWIHLLSVYTLWSVLAALYFIRRGNMNEHRKAMIGTFIGLSIAATLALLPGRRMGAFLFGW